MKKLLKFKSSINFKLLVTSLSFLAISTIAFFACTKQNSSSNSQSDDHIVQSFLQSQTFSRHREFIETLGSISYKDIKAATLNVNDKDSFNVLNIPINKNGRKVGYIEVVDLKNTKYFPNNDTYALNYVDLKNFDTKSLTGNVEMIDLNYDNFVHSRISIENNNIIKWNSNGLSSELSLKYQTIKKP